MSEGRSPVLSAIEVHPLSDNFPEPWRSLGAYKKRHPREGELFRDCYDLDRIASDLVWFLRREFDDV